MSTAMDPLARTVDDSLLRELPQLQSLRIAPLRQPISLRTLSVPSLLESNTNNTRDSNAVSKSNLSNSSIPASLPTLTEFLDAARTKGNDPSVESLLSLELPPKPILPAFVNLRALERTPYSSFDDDPSHARKRLRLDAQVDSFSEHLQLPIPQAQKEQRPPPFGPFAILNGLNEPPPNAAILPPIESSSIHQLLNRPTKDELAAEPVGTTSNSDSKVIGKREWKIEEILDSSNCDKADVLDGGRQEEKKDTGEKLIGHDEHEFSESEAEKYPSCREQNEPTCQRTRGRSRTNTRKWTEEETIDLFLGVIKCGIGNWKTILAQPELRFNRRTASNLKDRFRFCCPWAYRATDQIDAMGQLHETLSQITHRTQANDTDAYSGKINSLYTQSFRPGTEQDASQSEPAMSANEPLSTSVSPRRVYANSSAKCPLTESAVVGSDKPKHLQEPLEALGYDLQTAPRRRCRRPFTTMEDDALLKGYAIHGFQWTLIQQDKQLDLSHRRSTDLRDRFRNKFPDVYRHGGPVSSKLLQVHSPRIDGHSDTMAGEKHKPLANNHKTSTHSGNELRNAGRFTVQPTGRMSLPFTYQQSLLPDTLDDHPTGMHTETPPEATTLPPLVWDEVPD